MSNGIHKAMAAVMAEIKAIGKDQGGGQGGGVKYKFRGIDDVYNHVQPLLAKHSIFCLPEALSSTMSEYKTSTGKTMQHCISRVKYSYMTEDGSKVETVGSGEGADVGDKALSKSLAMAHKYNIVQTFCIPTGEPDPDGEATDMSGGKAGQAPAAPPQEAPPTEAEVKASDEARTKFMTRLQDFYALNVPALLQWWKKHEAEINAIKVEDDRQAVKNKVAEIKKHHEDAAKAADAETKQPEQPKPYDGPEPF